MAIGPFEAQTGHRVRRDTPQRRLEVREACQNARADPAAARLVSRKARSIQQTDPQTRGRAPSLPPPPPGLFLGTLDRSRRQTRKPAAASVLAAVAPAGPAPTTRIGVVGTA